MFRLCVYANRREPDVAEQALQTFSAVDRDRAAALVAKKALTSAVVGRQIREPYLALHSPLSRLAASARLGSRCPSRLPLSLLQEWLQSNNRKLKNALQAEQARAADAQRLAADCAAEAVRAPAQRARIAPLF